MHRLHFFQGKHCESGQDRTANGLHLEGQSASQLPLFLQFSFLFTYCSKCQVKITVIVLVIPQSLVEIFKESTRVLSMKSAVCLVKRGL